MDGSLQIFRILWSKQRSPFFVFQCLFEQEHICVNIAELWNSCQAETRRPGSSSCTRGAAGGRPGLLSLLHGRPSPGLPRASALRRKLELFPAPVTTAPTSRSFQPAQSRQQQGKDFRPTPPRCARDARCSRFV